MSATTERSDVPAPSTQPTDGGSGKDWTDLLTTALPALIGIVVGFLTAQTFPEVESVLGSDFTAPFVFVGIFIAIVGFVAATVFANVALRTMSVRRRALQWALAILFFSGGVLALAAVLSIRAQPVVSEPTPFYVELTLEGRTEYQDRASEQARLIGLENPARLAEQCAVAIPQPVRVVAIGGTIPSPLVVIPGEAISANLPCPSIRIRILGNRGVAIPIATIMTGSP